MIFPSPYPDIEIPDVSLTTSSSSTAAELRRQARAHRRAQRPHLHLRAAARTPSRSAAGALAARGFRKGDVFAIYAPNVARVRDRLPRGRRRSAACARRSTRSTPSTSWPSSSSDAGRALLVTVAGAREGRAGGRGAGVRRCSSSARPRARRPSRRCSTATAARRLPSRSTRRGPRRAALFERDDRPAEGRDAHPSQPGGQHPADRRPSGRDRRGRRHASAFFRFFHIYGSAVDHERASCASGRRS